MGKVVENPSQEMVLHACLIKFPNSFAGTQDMLGTRPNRDRNMHKYEVK